MIKQIIYLPLLFAFLWACKAKNQPAPPAKEVSTKVYTPSLSKINVPLVVKTSELEKTLNREMSGVLYEDNSYTNNNNDNIKVSVSKHGQIEIDVKNDVIIYEVPLRFVIKGRQPVLFTELKAETEFEISLKFQSKLDVDQQWNLITETKALDYELLNEPKLDFGVTSISLKGVVDVLLANFLDDAAPLLDTQIKENFDTRKYVNDLWVDMQEPILLDEAYNSWMKVTPKYFVYAPIKAQNNQISLNVGVNAYVEVITGKRPDFTLNTTLPDLIKKEQLSNEFFISLKTELYYEKMNEIMQENLVGYEYEYTKSKKIVVTDASIYGNGEKLVVKVTFSGNMQGTFYMTGIPKFNEEMKTVYLDDFDFDIQSKAVVLKTAAWVLKGSFKKQIDKYLRFSLQEQVDESVKMIEEYLKESQLDKTIRVNCKVNDAKLNEVYLSDQSMTTILDLSGNLNVYFGR